MIYIMDIGFTCKILEDLKEMYVRPWYNIFQFQTIATKLCVWFEVRPLRNRANPSVCCKYHCQNTA